MPLKAQLHALVDDHGFVPLIKTLITVCAERSSEEWDGSYWHLSRKALYHVLDALKGLSDVPGITKPVDFREAPTEPPKPPLKD